MWAFRCEDKAYHGLWHDPPEDHFTMDVSSYSSKIGPNPKCNRGSVFFMLFACVAMVGVLGTTSINLLKGPVRAMSEVTKRTIAENHMIASGRLALVMAAKETGDCDEDGLIEPLEWKDAEGAPAPMNGGLLPATIGAALQDPWGNAYGYCAWDHGGVRQDDSCGEDHRRLEGAAIPSNLVLAIISSGPDQIFQTGCQAEGHAQYLLKVPGNDDVVLGYSFAEAVMMSGGLWDLKENDADTATIAKNLSVTDDSGIEQLSFDTATNDFSLAAGGTGNLPNIKTDFIQSLSENSPVEFLADIKTGAATIETASANAVAAIVTSSGSSGIGLKASGTSKAIEAEGIIDMMNNKIVNVSLPSDDNDAATKKYVDDKMEGPQSIKCESFVFTTCTGASSAALDKSNLGACKKACEEEGVQCCEAEFAALPGNPNAQLANCKGHSAPSQTSGGVRNILTILLGGGKFVSALCYLE